MLKQTSESKKSENEVKVKQSKKNRPNHLYDKIPLSFNQVDIIVKVLLVLFTAFIIFAFLKSNNII